MGLIRSLVAGEANIAIDPVGTVFRVQRCNIGIDLSESFDQLLYEMFSIFFGIQITGFVLLEPGFVIILLEVFEEFECGSFEHERLFGLFDPSPVLAALDTVHGHFADMILFGQFLDGQLPVLAG